MASNDSCGFGRLGGETSLDEAWRAASHRRRLVAVVGVASSLALSAPVVAQGASDDLPPVAPLPVAQDGGDEGPTTDDEVPSVDRPLAAVFAFVPGILVGGSGHFALGQRQTAYRLFALQGVAMALISAGVVPLIFTVANRYSVTPLAMTAIGGAAVGSSGWLADVYGTMVPPEYRGLPRLRLPHLQAELGYRYVHEPAFDYGSFAVNALDVRYGPWRLRPSAWVALDNPNGRLRALGAYRYFGPRAAPSGVARTGTFLDLEAAVTHHRYGSEGFSILTGEVVSSGRLDLAVYDENLTGMFADLSMGFGLQRYAFDQVPPSRDSDHAWLLLARFGFGAYLGRSEAPRGEVVLYYDHRHDGFAAGMTGAMVGIPGHAGLESELYVSDRLGLRAEVQLGAAVVGGLSLLVRQEVQE